MRYLTFLYTLNYCSRWSFQVKHRYIDKLVNVLLMFRSLTDKMMVRHLAICQSLEQANVAIGCRGIHPTGF